MSNNKNYSGSPTATSEIMCGNCGMDFEHHKDWCKEISKAIYERFGRTFREIYNILELSLDKEKAEIAKDLAGNKIMEVRNDSIDFVNAYFNK